LTVERAATLSRLLDELDLTNKDLSRLCEVAPATVQRWLAGSGPIPMAVIRMLMLMVHVRRASELCDVNHEHPQVWLNEQLEGLKP
jgi:hypothetical protein